MWSKSQPVCAISCYQLIQSDPRFSTDAAPCATTFKTLEASSAQKCSWSPCPFHPILQRIHEKSIRDYVWHASNCSLFNLQLSVVSQSFGTSTESTTLTFISLCHNMSQPSLYRDATFKPFASFAQPIHWCSQAHVTSPPSLTNIVAVQPGRVLKAKFYGPRRPMAAQAAHIATFRKDVKTCEDMGRHVKTTNISRILEEKTRFVFWTSFIPQE